MTRETLLATLLVPASFCFLAGCEYKLEGGTYLVQASGTAHYVGGAVEDVDKEFRIEVNMGQDSKGLRPDILVFTLCQDAIDSLAFETCFEPIEVTAKNNHFGGEEIFYSDYTLESGGTEYDCDQREDVVLSGEITSKTSFEFDLTYVATIEDWGTEGCSAHYPYPTSLMLSGEAWLE